MLGCRGWVLLLGRKKGVGRSWGLCGASAGGGGCLCPDGGNGPWKRSLGESFCLGHGALQPQTPCGVLLLSLCFLRQDKATPRTTFSLLQYPISTDFGRKRMGFFFFRHHLALKNFQHLFCLFFPFPSWKNLTDFCFFFFFPPIRKPSQASGFLGSGGAGDGKQPGPHPRVGTAGAAAAGSALGAEQHKRPI